MSAGEGRLRMAAWIGLVLLGVLYLSRIGGFVLQDPDEGRYAEIPREMIELGDWVTPRLNYVKYFEKPPLLYWLVASSFRVFGTTEGAARLVPALASLTTLLLIYRFGLAFAGRRGALLATGFLATSPLFFVLSQVVLIDSLLTTFFTATMLAVFAAHRSSGKGPWCVAAGVATALGVLAKGPVALVLPGAIALVFLLWQRDFATLRALLRPAPLVAFLAVTLPWFVLVSLRNPEFLQVFFVREHFERFASDNVGHPEGPLFFLPVLLWAMLPWTLLAMFLAFRGQARGALADVDAGLRRYCLLWAVGVVLFFSVGSSKLPPYILPAMPPLALLLGVWIDRVMEDAEVLATPTRAAAWLLCAVGGALLPVAVIAFAAAGWIAPWFETEPHLVQSIAVPALIGGLTSCASGAAVLRWRLWSREVPAALAILVGGFGLTLLAALGGKAAAKTTKPLAVAIAEATPPGEEPLVVVYRRFYQSLVFYTGGRLVILEPSGTFNEVDIGVKAEPEAAQHFWRDPDRLREVWASDRTVFVATDISRLEELKPLLSPEPRLLARSGRRVLVINRPATEGATRDASLRTGG